MLGRVYKIENSKETKVYVGSTLKALEQRLNEHLYDFALWKRNPRSRANLSSFRLLEKGECSIVLLESCVCESRRELHERERYWIETLDTVNLLIPTRTWREYREANRERHVEATRIWNQKYKERAKRPWTCPTCGVTVMYKNQWVHKTSKKHVAIALGNKP